MAERFTTLPIGPWPLGMANAMRDTEVPEEALGDAVNVNIRQDGTAVTRLAWDQVLPEAAHSMFQHEGVTYAVVGSDLCRLDASGATPISVVNSPLSWDTVNGDPVFATTQAVHRIWPDGVVEMLSGVIRGPNDMQEDLVPMPGGHWLSYWNGRLIVARGRKLLFSEPLRYGAHNTVKGYITLPSRAEWVVALETGFYVGLIDHVLFFAGRELKDLVRTRVAGQSAPGMGLRVSNEYLPEALASFPQVAVFLTRSGFAVGTPRGDVLYPQASRLENLPLFRGRLMQSRGRIFAIRGF